MNSYFSKFNGRKQSPLISWLKLLRLPNLFTAIGDPLAGLCIASLFLGQAHISTWKFISLPLCSLLLYAAGIILNDWHDIPEDRRHNPDRPLAAGMIAPATALLVAVIMILCALFLAFLIGRMALLMAIVLVLAIVAYNNILKQYPKQGALCMGLCRMLSFLLGASALQITVDATIPALTVLSYITYVTFLADNENRSIQIPDKNVFYPALIFILGWTLSAITVLRPHFHGTFLVSLLFAVAGTLATMFAAYRIYNRSIRPNEAHSFIGTLISSAIPMQTAFIVLAFPGHLGMVAGISIILWIVTVVLGKTIQQS